MRTSQLLWNLTWRGGAWGFPVGLLLGGLYSMLVLGIVILVAQLAGTGPAQLPPIPFLIYTILLLGIVGGVIGGVIGMVSGPIGGLLCFILTRLFFFPLRQARRYRWVMEIAGALYGAAATLIGVQLISQFSIAPPVGGTGNVMMFYFFPGLIAGLGCLFVSRQIAAWYENESDGKQIGPVLGQVASIKPAAP